MALHVITILICWTPRLPLFDLISMFHDKKVDFLYQHIRVLVRKSFGVRDLILKFLHHVKSIELATLLMAASYYDNTLSTMYLSTTIMPPEHHFERPLMLRQLVASRISLLLKEEIHFKLTAAHRSDEAYATYKKKMMGLTTVMKLLESADRDESWVNRYLKTNLIPSLFRPWGVFKSLMPRGYSDSFRNYDGLDISNGSAAELFFRKLNGRKIEELSFEDLCIFRSRLGGLLQPKFQETIKLQALEMERNRKPTEKLKNKTPKTSPCRIPTSNHNLHTSRTTAAALACSLPVYSSTRSSLLLGSGRKMRWIVNGDYDHDFHREACCCPDSKQKKCIEVC